MRNKVTKSITANFDEKNPNWSDIPEYTTVFLRAQQSYLNMCRENKPFVTMNEVFDSLGFARTNDGMVYGWAQDSGPIDFGIDHNDVLAGVINGGFQLTFTVEKIYKED